MNYEAPAQVAAARVHLPARLQPLPQQRFMHLVVVVELLEKLAGHLDLPDRDEQAGGSVPPGRAHGVGVHCHDRAAQQR